MHKRTALQSLALAVALGGELTVDDGLVWLRHRAYHAATRSFMQTDPWPPVAGTV